MPSRSGTLGSGGAACAPSSTPRAGGGAGDSPAGRPASSPAVMAASRLAATYGVLFV